MRTAQVKVALPPADREVLDWAAQCMGERLAGYAAGVLAEHCRKLLADGDVRMAYRLHRQHITTTGPDGDERLYDAAGARALRDLLRPGVLAR